MVITMTETGEHVEKTIVKAVSEIRMMGDIEVLAALAVAVEVMEGDEVSAVGEAMTDQNTDVKIGMNSKFCSLSEAALRKMKHIRESALIPFSSHSQVPKIGISASSQDEAPIPTSEHPSIPQATENNGLTVPNDPAQGAIISDAESKKRAREANDDAGDDTHASAKKIHFETEVAS